MDPLLLNASFPPGKFNFTFSTEEDAAAAVEELMSAFSTSLLVYREPRSVVLIACYVPLFLLAAVSNALVIYVVTRFHYMRRTIGCLGRWKNLRMEFIWVGGSATGARLWSQLRFHRWARRWLSRSRRWDSP
ncbi:hypothetical protein J437_LFUL014808 [Ladona fulva]|uniref:Uncharacterized protein n=1 Tax=Ladona fulva TaxID=123851 RepID=A0A8K0KGA3_LADFU|nr:hypothetical protein J437_LFUL014808 [Ladona fulva]